MKPRPATAATLQNEKSICAIGRDMVTTGRLHAEGCAAALEALSRFRMIADGLNVEASRGGGDSGGARCRNGAEFVRRAEARLGRADPRSWRARTKPASPPKAWWRAFPTPMAWPPIWAAAAGHGLGQGRPDGCGLHAAIRTFAADGPVAKAIPTRRATSSTRACAISPTCRRPRFTRWAASGAVSRAWTWRSIIIRSMSCSIT